MNIDPIQKRIEEQKAVKRSREAIELAYDAVLETDAGQIVLSDILTNLFHLGESSEPEARVLQQFAAWLLHRSRLVPEDRGSFPLEYVNALWRLKLLRQDPSATVPEPGVSQEPRIEPPVAPKVAWWRRILQRKD